MDLSHLALCSALQQLQLHYDYIRIAHNNLLNKPSSYDLRPPPPPLRALAELLI